MLGSADPEDIDSSDRA